MDLDFQWAGGTWLTWTFLVPTEREERKKNACSRSVAEPSTTPPPSLPRVQSIAWLRYFRGKRTRKNNYRCRYKGRAGQNIQERLAKLYAMSAVSVGSSLYSWRKSDTGPPPPPPPTSSAILARLSVAEPKWTRSCTPGQKNGAGWPQRVAGGMKSPPGQVLDVGGWTISW